MPSVVCAPYSSAIHESCALPLVTPYTGVAAGLSWKYSWPLALVGVRVPSLGAVVVPDSEVDGEVAVERDSGWRKVA